MQLKHTVGFFKKIGKLPEHVLRHWEYRSDRDSAEVNTDEIDPTHLSAIYRYAVSQSATDALAKNIVKRIDGYRKLLADPSGSPVGKLERLETALIEYLRPAKHKFIFKEERDGQMCPYYVSEVQYTPPRGSGDDYCPAYVKLTALAISFDETDNFTETWHTDDIVGGKTVPEILKQSGLYRETPEAYAAYLAEVERFNEIVDQLGKQYTGVGVAFDKENNYYGYGMLAMERDGVPARLIIDRKGDNTDKADREPRRAASAVFWIKGSAARKNENEDGEEEMIAIPVHPYVRAFDLGLHLYVGIHVNSIEPYQYDSAIAAKLVLPEKTKQLLNVLVESSAEIMEDIVAGKTGGTVVLATGPAGTGKTLTAECYSEQVGLPLYSVQCSQLGTDEEELEKRLMLTLRRASRWGAILLIDESDVYVRERGDDIQQNAIVGVFLRLLERYRGILFLTSNRATIIDDAILSRAVAHIHYVLPTPEERAQLWEVLSQNYKIELSEEQIADLVVRLPNVSGRNVKNILKLATIMSSKTKQPVGVDDLVYVTRFVDLAQPDTAGIRTRTRR